MGNRAWLYLQTDQDGDTQSCEIASANNNLPTLWQVLLAVSETTQADTRQRVFGDAGSDGLRAPAHPARARLYELAAFLIGRERAKQSLYCLQLEGAALWLEQLLEAEDDGVECWLNANLDELSWLYSGEPEQFIAAVRQQCNERWQALRERMAADDVAGVLALLNVNGVQDEDGWAWQFGLSGLDHPYFAETDEPLQVRFDEFEAQSAIDNAHLGHNLYAFDIGELWGVRNGREPEAAVLVPAQYEGIWPFENGLAAVMKDDKFGFIDLAGNLALSPCFENVDDFSPANLAPACENGLWGLIDRQGDWVVAPAWDEMSWSADLYAWVPERNDGKGLLTAQGRALLPPDYEALGAFVSDIDPARQWSDASMRIVTRREDKVGMVDCAAQPLIPMVYTGLGKLVWVPSDDPTELAPAPPGVAGRYVRTSLCVEHPEWYEWFESVYDLHAQRQVLPDVHEVFGLKWADMYGWLCTIAPDDPSEYCTEGLQTGIAHADGSWLHEPIYAWIAQPKMVVWSAEPIAEHWNRDAGVPAQRAEDGAMVLLHADGRAEPAPLQHWTFQA